MPSVPAEFYLISNVLQSVWKLRDILLCTNGKYTEKSAQISAVELIFIVAIEDHRFIILLFMFHTVNVFLESLFEISSTLLPSKMFVRNQRSHFFPCLAVVKLLD